jgi:hypothetical protein
MSPWKYSQMSECNILHKSASSYSCGCNRCWVDRPKKVLSHRCWVDRPKKVLSIDKKKLFNRGYFGNCMTWSTLEDFWLQREREWETERAHTRTRGRYPYPHTHHHMYMYLPVDTTACHGGFCDAPSTRKRLAWKSRFRDHTISNTLATH